jgi:probable HAF family extracellular repeat protein
MECLYSLRTCSSRFVAAFELGPLCTLRTWHSVISHVATFVESADSRSRGRGGRPTRGQAVGTSNLAGDTTHHAFLWTKDDGMQDLGTLYGLPVSWAQAINNKGQVVGFSQDLNSNNTVASLWQDGVLTDLNTLIPPNSPLFLIEALGINDRGQISGYGFDSSTGEYPAFLATPCDEDHPGAEGRDYSSVAATPAVHQASSAVRDASSRTLPQSLMHRMNRFHFPGRAFGPRKLAVSEANGRL